MRYTRQGKSPRWQLKKTKCAVPLGIAQKAIVYPKGPQQPMEELEVFKAPKKLLIVMRPRNEGNVDSHGSYYDDATVSP